MCNPANPNSVVTTSKALGKNEYNKFFLDQDNLPCIRVGKDEINTTTEMTLVQAGDAAGKIATLTEYNTGSLNKVLYTFSYEDALFPTTITKIVTTKTTT